MPPKQKDVSTPSGVFMMHQSGGLPLWDEAAVQHENWGGSLGLPARKPGSVVDISSTESKIVVSPDEEERAAFTQCIAAVARSHVNVHWRRPSALFAPFRPMVHRNTTPFLHPYADPPKLFNATVEGEASKPHTAQSGKRNEPKSVAPPVPLHQQFPEIVLDMTETIDTTAATDTIKKVTPSNKDSSVSPTTTTIAPNTVIEVTAKEVSAARTIVTPASTEWENVTPDVIVARYRALQPLLQPYDPTLEHGCALTPLEACASRYSTALRHRLREVDELGRLVEPPPFLMGAFNSALRVVEHAQSLLGKGVYLWELIHPHAPGTTHPVYNPYGKYTVRLFVDGAYRRVTVDDFLPVDALGRPFLSYTMKKEIWPAILAKAIFKALGPGGRHLLFTDPEVSLSCLMGEWLPRHIRPQCELATACGFLLAYKHQLPCGMTVSTPFEASGSPQSTERGTFLSSATNNAMATQEPIQDQQEQQPRDETNDESGIKEATLRYLPDDLFQSGAQDFSPDWPVILACGIAGEGTRRQLYVLHEIVSFHNTLALRVSTDPPVEGVLRSSILTADNTNEDAMYFIQNIPSEETVSSVWVTFEEFCEYLDMTVWLPFNEESPFKFNLRFSVTEDPTTGTAGHKKRNATSMANALANVTQQRNSVRWIHLTCEKPERIALVSIGAIASPEALLSFANAEAAAAAVAGGAVVAAGGGGGGGGASGAGSKSRPSSGLSGNRPSSSRSVKSNLSVVGAGGAVVVTDNSPGAPTPHLPRSASKRVEVELFKWDRGDPFSRAWTFSYKTGHVQCAIQTLPAGSHILRVTARDMEPHHAVLLLSTHEFSVGDERDALRNADVFKMTDAGIHDAVCRAGEEVVWMKRRITVREPTMASFIFSTLDYTEDLAAHRDIPATFAKEVKNPRARVVNAKGAMAKGSSMEELPVSPCEIPILPHCHVLLIDLATGEKRAGAIGRLVDQKLEANPTGYLLMAYAVLDKPPAASIPSPSALEMEGDAQMVSMLAVDSPIGASQHSSFQEELIPREHNSTAVSAVHATTNSLTTTLCGPGLWKLTVSAKHPLDSYKSIPHNVITFEDKGQLRRGSNGLLFAYTCIITENTSLSLLLDLEAQDLMPFTLKFLRSGVDVPPVFVSALSQDHLFIPHVLLELGEKARSATYTIEAWLDEARVNAWEERRRRAQEVKFRYFCAEAEAAALSRQQTELAEYAADPAAFLERLEQRAAEPAEPSFRETGLNSSKRSRAASERRRPAGEQRRRSLRESLRLTGTPSRSPPAHALDVTEETLAVRFALRVRFSARVDVRSGAPPREPSAALRALFSPNAADALGEAPARSGAARGGKAPRDAAGPSAEELHKADLGRQSRARFLRNPRALLMPYLAPQEDAPSPRERPSADGRQRERREECVPPGPPAMRVVTHVDEEPGGTHAPLLEAAAYCVRLLPLRAVEVSAPSPTAALQRDKSPNGRTPLAAASPLPAAALEEDPDAAEIRAPAVALTQHVAEEIRREQERRLRWRDGMKERVRAYWSLRCPENVPVSLLGAREDDSFKRNKGRSKANN